MQFDNCLKQCMDGMMYCCGKQMCVADICLAVCMRFCIKLCPGMMKNCPTLAAFCDRMNQRPKLMAFFNCDRCLLK